ncbi:hypothetical protein PG997_010365 [Apiospora hydei]|uniref:Uncharacterized protein n=1 Tax=Apiospora hydei TaxID=1337664 RepID=A0ABR1VWX4_9PEZI
MKPSTVLSTLLTAVLLPAAQATWCTFYFDSKCTKHANSVDFDCNNMNLFSSGGSYVSCHPGLNNDNLDCLASRCSDQWCQMDPLSMTGVPANYTCTSTGGPGPYYMLAEWYNEGAY